MSERQQLIDELLDLQHDLGKYIHLPLSFLPRDAASADVSTAVRRALFETRAGPGGVRSAREIWSTFEGAMADRLNRYASFAVLRDVVERALAWEAAARADAEIDRSAVTADLTAVTQAVRNVIDEVNRDQ